MNEKGTTVDIGEGLDSWPWNNRPVCMSSAQVYSSQTWTITFYAGLYHWKPVTTCSVVTALCQICQLTCATWIWRDSDCAGRDNRQPLDHTRMWFPSLNIWRSCAGTKCMKSWIRSYFTIHDFIHFVRTDSTGTWIPDFQFWKCIAPIPRYNEREM